MRQTRKSYRNIVRAVALESVEPRRLFDSNAFALSGGSFAQNWSDTSIITTANTWPASATSLEGYNGVGLSGSDPTLITGFAGALNVALNTAATTPTNVSAVSAGGLCYFKGLADPVVALKGSGSVPAPFLVINLNTLNVSNVNLSYKLRDLDNRSNSAAQPYALQYRIGTSGNFTTLPAGTVADATDTGTAATLVTSISASLPVGAENQPVVQVRIITIDAGGTDEWVGVDDISVTSTPAVGPGSFSFSQSNYNASEGIGTATVTVFRGGGSTGAVSVDYATVAGGSATLVDDYASSSGTLNWADGDNAPKTFTVSIVDDGASEVNETINLQLSNPTNGATLGSQPTATITVQDNDAPSVLINEINVDPPATDNPFEYVEIKGTGSLNNLYFVAIQGETGSTLGKVSFVQNLSSSSLGSNGLAIVKAASGGPTVQDGTSTTVTNTAFSNGGGTLGNSSESFLLIYSPNSAITAAQALGDSTGALTGLPSGAVVVDALGWSSGASLDRVYGGVDLSFPLPTTTNIPKVASRVVGNNTANSATAWYYGQLAGATNDGLTYLATPASANLPTGAVLTPGAANFAGSIDNTPPTVSSKVFDFDTSAAAPSLTVTFSEPMSAITLSDLVSSTFTITDRSTNTAIPAANFVLTPVSTSVYKITFVGADSAPSDGDFKLTINAANAKDVAGNALAANESLNYAFLQADASVDRKVNTLDFNLLAGNFGNGGRKFSQGDFSFNGDIDSIDFGILVGQYGKSLPSTPPPAPVLSAVGGVGASLFGNAGIDDDGITSTDLV